MLTNMLDPAAAPWLAAGAATSSALLAGAPIGGDGGRGCAAALAHGKGTTADTLHSSDSILDAWKVLMETCDCGASGCCSCGAADRGAPVTGRGAGVLEEGLGEGKVLCMMNNTATVRVFKSSCVASKGAMGAAGGERLLTRQLDLHSGIAHGDKTSGGGTSEVR